MKSFIAAVVLFALVMALILANCLYVRKTTKEISALARDILKEGVSLEKCSLLKEQWNKRRKVIEFSISERKIERMNELIESLWSAQSLKNLPESERACYLIIDLCEELYRSESFSLEGIF